MDAWIQLCAYVVSNLHNFGRSWLVCKKTIQVLVIDFKNNKFSNENSCHTSNEYHNYE